MNRNQIQVLMLEIRDLEKQISKMSQLINTKSSMSIIFDYQKTLDIMNDKLQNANRRLEEITKDK